MRPTRRFFLQSTATLPWLAPRAYGVQFPGERNENALFPTPEDGARARINPPGFAWWRAAAADSYRLLIRDSAGKTVYESPLLKDPVHLPSRTLASGDYTWDVEASGAGAVIARRGAWRFSVPAGLPEQPWQEPKSLLERVPNNHPRYVFPADELARVRESLSTTRRRAWEQIKPLADRALSGAAPQPPRYHTLQDRARRRMGYITYFREFRRAVDGDMSTLALAYLLTGEERYGLAAKKILLEIEKWGVEGPMSLLSPHGDEPGLSMARHGHRAYDWLYPMLDESERARVSKLCVDRARQALARLRQADYLAAPAESHNGRLIAYLAEHAIVLKDEAPDASEWLDYSLRALMTFYPHWADADGGWAEGVTYALSYNSLYLAALESLRAGTGLDLYQRPFFRNIRRFLLYCVTPKGEIKPFGDGAEAPGGPGGAGAVLMTHYARRYNDPVAQWWAGETGAGPADAADPLVALYGEDTVQPSPPSNMPSAAVFRGIGWAALHSSLADPARDTFFLFKSSPFGSVSHSHADQNSFCVLKGGHALAIASGYYGPAYGMPHHADWTRQTKANNCVLVNGAGQAARSHRATGRITRFEHKRVLTYVAGDATPAYSGKLTRFVRHVVFLRPGVFVMLDDLAAPAPADFEWRLHAFQRIEMDPVEQLVVSNREGTYLAARLYCDAGLFFDQTDTFDTPYNEGNPDEYFDLRPNQWHFRAATETKVKETRIAAFMIVRDQQEGFATERKQHPGWVGMSVTSDDGAGEIWAQVTAGASPPAAAPAGAGLIAASWKPKQGEAELLVF